LKFLLDIKNVKAKYQLWIVAFYEVTHLLFGRSWGRKRHGCVRLNGVYPLGPLGSARRSTPIKKLIAAGQYLLGTAVYCKKGLKWE